MGPSDTCSSDTQAAKSGRLAGSNNQHDLIKLANGSGHHDGISGRRPSRTASKYYSARPTSIKKTDQPAEC
jgi:hypothetical protein